MIPGQLLSESLEELTSVTSREQANALSPRVEIYLEKGDYLVKTVTTPEEFIAAMHLRKKVFLEEFAGIQCVQREDVDWYDGQGDILIIYNKKENSIVGTYRLICSKFSHHFYSQTEFELDRFLDLPGTKLELSRACVSQNHRGSLVLHLLWRGIREYIKEVEARYLFGCSSLPTMKLDECQAVYRYLKSQKQFSDEYHINPKSGYQLDDFDLSKTFEPEPTDKDEEAAKAALPSLLRTYLKAGANVYGSPALDKEFSCIDLLTILDYQQLTDKFVKKYH